MPTKTAEQMNAERRAAKQRQQAAAKARTVNKEKNLKFSIQEATKEISRRQRHLKVVQHNHEQEIKESFSELLSKGALKIEMFQSRSSWISWCFDLIKLIRSHKGDDIEYNKDWKETGIFVAGVVRS